MSDPFDREATVFNAARRLPAEARAAFLAEACIGDTPLRQRVEELLDAGEQAGRFLQEPAVGALRPAESFVSLKPAQSERMPAEKVGDRIGRFRLLQQIGEGGCGVVYMAEQEEPVRRRVALKVIKLNLACSQKTVLHDHDNETRKSKQQQPDRLQLHPLEQQASEPWRFRTPPT
jgi:eukaryotic-like serine/threonine-protein kinase